MAEESFCLRLAKEDFKFSSAHFTLFAADHAELMHGHNYQVGLELSGSRLDDEGLLADFVSTKAAVRELCDLLDTRTLIPQRSRHLTIDQQGNDIEIRFRDRRYVLPAADVLLMPLINTSIEELARWLWHELRGRLDFSDLDMVGVQVGETAGQSCWYRRHPSA